MSSTSSFTAALFFLALLLPCAGRAAQPKISIPMNSRDAESLIMTARSRGLQPEVKTQSGSVTLTCDESRGICRLDLDPSRAAAPFEQISYGPSNLTSNGERIMTASIELRDSAGNGRALDFYRTFLSHESSAQGFEGSENLPTGDVHVPTIPTFMMYWIVQTGGSLGFGPYNVDITVNLLEKDFPKTTAATTETQ